MNPVVLSKPRAIVQSMRGSFLVLPLMCVLLGVATAYQVASEIDALSVSLIVLGAVLAHISVNMLNEYHDFQTGLDFHTQRTPFSGGSGALPAQPEAAKGVLLGGVITLLATVAIGGYFIWQKGWDILLYGILGVALIVLYTGAINKRPLLCLIAPGLGFGFLMVVGTHLLLVGSTDAQVWLAAAVPFFLASNLLLLNQFPDAQVDRQFGRNHLLIAWGLSSATWAFCLFWLAAVACVIYGVVAGLFPLSSLAALIALVPGGIAVKGAFAHGEHIGQQPQFMAANVITTLLTPLVLAITLLL